MKFNDTGDELLIECSGRRLYCHLGILGLSAEGSVTYGYDGGLDQREHLTAEERREIADYMVGLWLQWGRAQ